MITVKNVDNFITPEGRARGWVGGGWSCGSFGGGQTCTKQRSDSWSWSCAVRAWDRSWSGGDLVPVPDGLGKAVLSYFKLLCAACLEIGVNVLLLSVARLV